MKWTGVNMYSYGQSGVTMGILGHNEVARGEYLQLRIIRGKHVHVSIIRGSKCPLSLIFIWHHTMMWPGVNMYSYGQSGVSMCTHTISPPPYYRKVYPRKHKTFFHILHLFSWSFSLPSFVISPRKKKKNIGNRNPSSNLCISITIENKT